MDEEHDAILIGFGLNPESTTFRDVDGDPGIQFVIRVLERGEFLAIFTPQAWNVEDCPHRAAVFEAIASIQTQYKMLRFDYDPSDGEIRPNVELPLEDSELTSRQFHRLMHGMLHGVPRFDRVIRHAIETGEVSFAGLADEEPAGAPPPQIARLQRLAEEVGGIDALERLACGGDEAGGGEAGDRKPRCHGRRRGCGAARLLRTRRSAADGASGEASHPTDLGSPLRLERSRARHRPQGRLTSGGGPRNGSRRGTLTPSPSPHPGVHPHGRRPLLPPPCRGVTAHRG